MVDYRSILVERMEYRNSILYLYCRTFYKVIDKDSTHNKYDYSVYHRKILKFKNVKRFEYYLDEQIYNFIYELDDLKEELGIFNFSKIFNRSKKRNRLYIFETGYFGDFIMIEFKDEKSKKIEINEKEKYLEIKKELLKILQSKKEKLEENNIKIEVVEDKEDSYIINLESDKKNIKMILKIPNSTRPYYIKIIKKEKKYGESVWYDEEYYTISDIVKHLNITLDRFLKEKK